MPHNPFRSIEKCKAITSSNPKNIQNCKYEGTKYGLEISDHRDQVAFRVAKYRALKKLHASKSWESLSPTEKKVMEGEVVAQLVAKHDVKKRRHEREWIRKVEADEVEVNELEAGEVNEDDSKGEIESIKDEMYETGDSIGKWKCVDEHDSDDWKDIDDYNIGDEAWRSSFIQDVAAIKEKFKKGWIKKFEILEERAKETWLDD